MSEWFWIGLIMIVFSLLLMGISFVEYARKKMSDSFLLMWMLIELGITVLGLMIILGGHINTVGDIVILGIGILIFLLLFILSKAVSELAMKTRELAMHVALLNQENGRMLQIINRLEEEEIHRNE